LQSGSSFLISQLLGQAPMLALYLAAIVFALVFRARSPLASTLVLAGAGLNLAVSLTWTFALQAAYSRSNMLGIQRWATASQLLHVAGHALMLAAAFVDRGPQRASAFEVRAASYAPPPPPLPVRPYGE
jgi:hypothetical protein